VKVVPTERVDGAEEMVEHVEMRLETIIGLEDSMEWRISKGMIFFLKKSNKWFRVCLLSNGRRNSRLSAVVAVGSLSQMCRICQVGGG
jgi:FMN phosphatase YigB (HAD superfamily)